ncbi:hypothetical protein OH687_38150 [Burkholderia anthina]|nr:hypothetical protein OH687_38150 [Burkholderia anthina]
MHAAHTPGLARTDRARPARCLRPFSASKRYRARLAQGPNGCTS